ncbi:unnamed protein product [Lymnaea stagnalis]|uniref:Vitellogenin n=1 Tax=Lymnaea stagnalis TaxID=6523 RepID=A0AAV2I2B9_LYMST
MLPLVVCALIGITTAANVINEQAFRSGKEYVYSYESQILTGIPKHGSIHSGYRMSAQVRVQFSSTIDVRVQFDHINLYNVRQPITQMEAHENLIPEEFLKEIVGPESKTIIKNLMIPFGFCYKAGQVYKIALSTNETEWSANAKRGFMSLFEMNLNKRMLLAETVQESSSESQLPINSYKVLEHSAAGSCATWYTTEKVRGKEPRLYTTKVRDYTQCLDRTEYFKTMYEGFFPIGHTKDNPLTTGAILKHSIKGSAAKFMILSAVAESKIAFSPYWNKGAITTTVNQTLDLKEAKFINKSTEIPEVKPGKGGSLYMTIASKAVDSQDPFKPSTGQSKQESNPENVYSVDRILSHLRQGAENTIEVTSRESLVYLGVVTEMLSTSPKSVIKNLWEQLTISEVKPLSEVDKLARKILFDVLPHVGTEVAANHVLEVCTENFITNDCATAFNILTLKATPTQALIKKLITFIANGKQQMPAMVRQAAYLTLGSFGYKLSSAKSSQLKEIAKINQILQILQRDSSESAQKLVKDTKQQLENRRKSIIDSHVKLGQMIVETIEELIEKGTTPEKVLGLKALGNSGLPQAMPALKKIIANSDAPLFLRILGVLGHRRMYFDSNVRKNALKTMLNIYHDTTETNELRNFAFIVLMQLHPELPVIENIAKSLHNEKDAHVSSLVLSYLGSHANTTFYPFTSFVKNCSDALKFAPTSHFQNGHSFTKMVTKIYDGYKIGKVLSLTSIGSMSRFVGKAVTFDTYTFGMYSNFMEVGINSMNINQFFNKLFGPTGLFTLNKSFFDVLKRSARDTNPQEMIQEIFRKLQIKPRSTGVPASHVYIKVMGHELRYYDVTEYIRAITDEGKTPLIFDPTELSAGLPLDIEAMMYLMNTKLTLPTEAGFPVSLKFKVSKVLNVKGSLTFKVSPHMLEVDRMGSPPVKIQVQLDVKPKAVMEMYGSMGLDAHFIKRTISVRGLLEYDMPIQKEFSYDLIKNKFKLVGHLPEFDKPLMKMMFQPYAESVTLSSSNKSPMLQVDLLPLSSHSVIPVNQFYELKCLGYKIGFRGQIPAHFSWQHPLHLMGGKTHISFLKLRSRDTPQVVTFHGQIVYPMEKSILSSSELHMDGSEMKFETPISSLQDILPYNDPVDLANTTINMDQLVGKFEQLTGRDLPYHNKSEARGLILTLDASTEKTTRKSQIEILWGNFNGGQISSAFFRLWKSPVEVDSTDEWQAVAEMGVTYPFKLHKPEDILSKTWQQQVMKELEYHVSTSTHKASNYILESKLRSELKQLKYPAMIRTPTFRVLNNLIPEQLFKVLNLPGSSTSTQNWKKYWSKILPLQEKVLNEKHHIVNPSFINRDANILCYLEEITKVQKMLISDLDVILKMAVVPHGELPVAQWIVFNHATVVNFLDEIIRRYTATGTITKVKVIQDNLKIIRQNMDKIVKKMKQVIVSVTTVTEELDGHGTPITDTQPTSQGDLTDLLTNPNQAPGEYQANIPEIQGQLKPGNSPNSVNEPQDSPSCSDLDDLGQSLNQLKSLQMEVIDQIQASLTQPKDLNPELIQRLICYTQENLTFFDVIWKSCPVYDNIIIEKMLLVTVQNEFIIHLLTVYKKYDYKTPKMLSVDKQIQETLETFYVKVESIFLGQRVSSLYKQKMLQEVVTPNLNEKELQIYEDLKIIYRIMAVDRRDFETNFAYNKTSRQDHLQSGREINKLFENFESSINKVLGLQKAVAELENLPKLYLVSDLLGIIRLLKTNVEFGRQSLMPLSFPIRNTWIKILEKQATSVQRLTSSMSQIFEKFVLDDIESQKTARPPHVSTVPDESLILEVQDIITHQSVLLTELRNFLQDDELSSAVLQTVIQRVWTGAQILQETLLQSQAQVLTALEQKQDYDRFTVSSLFSQAIKQQRNIYDMVQFACTVRKDNLNGVTDIMQKVSSLIKALSLLDSSLNKTMSDLQKHKREASRPISQPEGSSDIKYQSELQPMQAWSDLPPSITASLNISWGDSGALVRNFRIQMIATRSMEQLFYLYKQMDSMVRSTGIENAINSILSDEMWDADHVMTLMNSYNHLHFAALFDKTALPPWIVKAGHSLHDYIRYYLWNSYSRHQALPTLGSDRTEVIMDLSDLNKKWDMFLMTNKETDKFLDIPLPKSVMAFKPNHNYKSVYSQMLSCLSTDFLPGQCIVYKEKVRTFDKVTYQIPASLALCPTVLAMDCSEEKSFVITIIKSNSSHLGHFIAIYNEDKLLEISPGYLDIEVKHNGQMLELKEGIPVTYGKLLQYQLYKTFMRVTRKSLRVSVELPLTGVSVVVEGSYIKIMVHPLFKKRLCGLCGNFDSQISWEYEGPENELHATPKSFTHSYILPNPNCPAPNDVSYKADLQHSGVNKPSKGNDKAQNGSKATKRKDVAGPGNSYNGRDKEITMNDPLN